MFGELLDAMMSELSRLWEERVHDGRSLVANRHEAARVRQRISLLVQLLELEGAPTPSLPFEAKG